MVRTSIYHGHYILFWYSLFYSESSWCYSCKARASTSNLCQRFWRMKVKFTNHFHLNHFASHCSFKVNEKKLELMCSFWSCLITFIIYLMLILNSIHSIFITSLPSPFTCKRLPFVRFFHSLIFLLVTFHVPRNNFLLVQLKTRWQEEGKGEGWGKQVREYLVTGINEAKEERTGCRVSGIISQGLGQ